MEKIYLVCGVNPEYDMQRYYLNYDALSIGQMNDILAQGGHVKSITPIHGHENEWNEAFVVVEFPD